MNPIVTKEFIIDSNDLSRVGEASTRVKTLLKQIGFPSEHIRRIAIAMYEGEINMVIHAHGGKAEVEIFPDRVEISLLDQGPGIADVPLAMREGYSTASEEARSMGFGAGMGLCNMKKYSDEMTVKSELNKGTQVHLVFHTMEE